MRIAVVGASGRTGREVLRAAAARGHDVVAVARRPGGDDVGDVGDVGDADGARWVRGDVVTGDGLVAALDTVEAVISAVGTGASRRPTTVYSRGVRTLGAAMRECGVRRLVVVSAGPAGPRDRLTELSTRLSLPVLELFFGSGYRDMRAMEADLAAAGTAELDWTVLRPPRLLARPASGDYRIGAVPPPGYRSISRADLAAALLDRVERGDHVGQAVYVSQ